MENSAIIGIINQIFDIEKKMNDMENKDKFNRNFKRIYFELEEGYNIIVKNPTGEAFHDSRIDCEANIVGNASTELVITDTIKPIIFVKHNDNQVKIIQRGVVIVSSK